MKLKQRKRMETLIDIELTLTADENDTLFAELEEITGRFPNGYRSMLKLIHNNMLRSTNVIREAD